MARPVGVTPESIEERRSQVADLLINGWNAPKIARHMDVHHSTIYDDIAAIRAQWAENQTHSYDEWVTAQLEKLDYLEAKYAHRVDTGDVAAGQLILKIQERRGKYLPIEQPTRLVITQNELDGLRAIAEQAGVLDDPQVLELLSDAG